MDKKLFAELIANIEQMGAYLRGEIPPERLRTRTYDGYQVITIEDPPETAPGDGDPPADTPPPAARTNGS